MILLTNYKMKKEKINPENRLDKSKEWAVNLLRQNGCKGFTLIAVTDKGYICSGFTVSNDGEIGAIKLGLERLLNHIEKWNLNPEMLVDNVMPVKSDNQKLNYMG